MERALALRNIGDVDKMAAAVDGILARPEPTAVIMGGGFIGVELAENLTERGVKVTIVELAEQLLAPLDVEMAALVEKHLVKHGVRVVTGGVRHRGLQRLGVPLQRRLAARRAGGCGHRGARRDRAGGSRRARTR